MAIYRTKDGDTVDWICWNHYGRGVGTTEAVLAANPGLTDHGARLPAGIEIALPDLPAPGRRRVTRLWD